MLYESDKSSFRLEAEMHLEAYMDLTAPMIMEKQSSPDIMDSDPYILE